MSGFIRQINASDGEPITAPTSVGISVSSWVVFANDAAYEAVYGAGTQGDAYYNSTELLVREHNGTEWVYGQNGINGLEDSTTTGSSQDLDPTYHNLLQVSNAGLSSVRSIADAQTSICYLVNNVGGDITLLHNSGTAPAGQALLLPGGVNFTLEDGNVAHFVKDTITNAWRYTNAAGSGGGSGTGTGAKNYVLSPDSSTSVTDVGGSVSSDITDVALIPEESKGVAVLVTQTAGAIGNTSTWETNAIDEGDGGSNGAAEWYWKTQAGYVDDAASIQWYNSDTSTIIYSQDIKAGTGRISKGMVDLPLTAGENVKPRIYWNVTSETNGIAVSGAGTLAETRLVGHAGWKQYINDGVTTDFTFSSTPAGWSIERASIVPYRTVDGKYRATLVINATTSSGSTPSVTIDGISFKSGINQPLAVDSGNQSFTGRATAGGSTIDVQKSGSTTTFRVSGDVELESWPTWADFDGSVMFGTEAQAQNARLEATSSNGQVVASNGIVIYETVVKDSLSAYDNTTGEYTVPANGDYRVKAQTTDNGANNHRLAIRVNGTEQKVGPTAASYGVADAMLTGLVKGDLITITNDIGASRTLLNVATFNYFDISRVPDKSSKATGFPFADQIPGEYGMVKIPNGSVTLDTGNGRGSTNTAIRRFSNNSVTGDAFTYTDSATDGMSIEANRDMLVSASYVDVDGAVFQIGITVNASNLTTSPSSSSVSERKAFGEFAANFRSSIGSAAFRVSKGDIIRAHQNPVGYTDGSNLTRFHILVRLSMLY
jgi:hypothetical protein